MASDEPEATPALAVELTDEEVERVLQEREEEEKKEIRETARKLEPGPCPACDGTLIPKEVHWLLSPFVARVPLDCPSCKLVAQPAPTTVGWALAIVLAVLLALGGMSAIFSAQRIDDGFYQKVAFLFGVVLFGGGLFLGYGVHGARSVKLLSQKILSRRRKRADEEAGAKEPEARSTWFQENLEAIVVAVILALIIRHFAMEAFVIPTGSMAPTLYGDHFVVECDNCSNKYALSKAEGEFAQSGGHPGSAWCPQCDHETRLTLKAGDVHGGHKILVNKFVYTIREPRRYEVIVFKYPEKPWRNYIKRLVGLPGEKIEIRNGDLWADDERARKEDHVQDDLWIPVHDAKNQRRLRDPPPRWQPVRAKHDGLWELADKEGMSLTCSPGKETTWLEYKRPIFDLYGYNRRGGAADRRNQRVADLRVRARVTPEDGAVVYLAILERDEGSVEPRILRARFEAGSGTAEYGIEVDGEMQHPPVTARALEPGQTAELTLAYADDRARLQIDGKTIVAWNDPFGMGTTTNSGVRIGATGADVQFEHLRIDRDIYYLRSNYSPRTDPAQGPIRVPDNSYFVMGDNSPNSEDGRKWGFVKRGHLIGRAFLVFWPVVPWQVKLIR